LEINKEELIKKLAELGAEDLGERHLPSLIFYDGAGEWIKSGKKFVRIRTTGEGIFMAFKDDQDYSLSGTREIEFEISDLEKGREFLLAIGLQLIREQDKIRNSFRLDGVAVDIDTWPKVPTLVEIEGSSEEEVKTVSAKLGFDWQNVVFGNSMLMIEKHYNIPVRSLKYYTFDRVE